MKSQVHRCHFFAAFFVSGLLGQSCLAQSYISTIATTPVEKLAKQVVILKPASQNQWWLSTLNISSKPPKKGLTAEVVESHAADQAWLQIAVDGTTDARRFTIEWLDSGAVTPTPYTRTVVKLPGLPQQPGPLPILTRSSQCDDGGIQTDNPGSAAGVTYRYHRTCWDRIAYGVPVTVEVMHFLAERVMSDGKTPLAVTLERDGKDGRTESRTFNFYPSEVKALVTEYEKLPAAKRP